jgi:hypothetical protein
MQITRPFYPFEEFWDKDYKYHNPNLSDKQKYKVKAHMTSEGLLTRIGGKDFIDMLKLAATAESNHGKYKYYK